MNEFFHSLPHSNIIMRSIRCNLPLMNKITAWSAAPTKSLYQGNSETEILAFRPFGFSCKKFPAVIFLGKNAPVSPLRVVVSAGT